MPAFEYLALDPQGREQRGVAEGETPRQVRQHLRTSGWLPLEVAEVNQRSRRGPGLRLQWRGRVRVPELALATRQLATLLRSGMPVEEALGASARQSGRRSIERVLLGLRGRVREGHSLADGLADFPHIFSELYRRTVEAGEQSGHLEIALERLADYLEQRQQMRQKVSLALIYPTLLTTVAILIVAGLLAYVVPQVVRVFDNIAQELPWMTRALIGVSDGLRQYGLGLLVMLAAGGIGLRFLLRRPHARAAWHRIVLRLPLIGRLTRGINTARFARTLGILLASGVQILDAMRIAGQVLTNVPMRAAVETAAQRVREGASLNAALEASGFFPPLTVSLIASGESSGDLETMLERAAVMEEREVDTAVGALLALFEPALILVMGGVVLAIVLAILLPIFELNQLVG